MGLRSRAACAVVGGCAASSGRRHFQFPAAQTKLFLSCAPTIVRCTRSAFVFATPASHRTKLRLRYLSFVDRNSQPRFCPAPFCLLRLRESRVRSSRILLIRAMHVLLARVLLLIEQQMNREVPSQCAGASTLRPRTRAPPWPVITGAGAVMIVCDSR